MITTQYLSINSMSLLHLRDDYNSNVPLLHLRDDYNSNVSITSNDSISMSLYYILEMITTLMSLLHLRDDYNSNVSISTQSSFDLYYISHSILIHCYVSVTMHYLNSIDDRDIDMD